MNRLYALAPLALMAACSKEDGSAAPQPSASAAEAAPAPSAEPSEASKPAAKALKIVESGKLFRFAYAYPAEAAAIPALKARLDKEKDEARASLIEEAKAGRAMADEEGASFNPYDRSIDWSVVASLPGWLSLLGGSYEFMGGAHGNSNSAALLWDKAADRQVDPLSLFVSKAAFNAALGPAYCQALNKERAKRREEPVDSTSGDEFDRCLDPSEVTVLLGSGDKAHFTRIGLIADPYVAGSYVEGSYEVTLPVTPKLIAAVKPQYRGAFAVGR